MTATVLSWRRDGVSLVEATGEWLAWLGGAICLLSTPARFEVAQLSADGSWGSALGTPPLAEAFECRCFTERAELRWLRDPSSVSSAGSAVVLSELEVPSLPGQWSRLDNLEAAEVISQQYLLWGEVADSGAPEGFVALEDARIGRLVVPFAQRPPRASRLALQAREYVCVVPVSAAGGAAAPAAGNAYVAEERLVRLRLADNIQTGGGADARG